MDRPSENPRNIQPKFAGSEEFTLQIPYVTYTTRNFETIREQLAPSTDHYYLDSVIGHSSLDSPGLIADSELLLDTKGDGYFRVAGYIDLDYSALESGSRSNVWCDRLRQAILDDEHFYSAEQINPYDDALYITQTDTRHFIRIQPQSNPDYGTVAIDTVPAHKVALYIRPDIDVDDIEQLKHEAKLGAEGRETLLLAAADTWARLHSLVIDTLSDSSDYAHVYLHPVAIAADAQPAPYSPEHDYLEPKTRSFDDIGGNFQAKQLLRTMIDIHREKQLAEFYRVSPQSPLLYGEPGTGKTSLIEIFADQLNAELVSVKSTDIVSKWVGNSAKNLDEFFVEAIKKSKSGKKIVLFFDEFEAIGKAADSVTSSERADLSAVFAQRFSEAQNSGVIVAAATNADISSLEPKLVRPGRFQPVAVKRPESYEEAVDIWSVILNKDTALASHLDDPETIQLYSDDISPFDLARHTGYLTGAEVQSILDQARSDAFQRAVLESRKISITSADIIRAFDRLRKQ